MAQAADFGTGKLQWQFATCVFGLAAAGLCIPFVPAAVRYARILFTEGENESAETRASGYALICLVGLAAAVIAISNAVPAARDLNEGPQARTVASCYFDQSPVKSSPTNTIPSSYQNEFKMTLDDKSKLVLVIKTEKRDELQWASGIRGTLYNGCLSHHPSSKQLAPALHPRRGRPRFINRLERLVVASTVVPAALLILDERVPSAALARAMLGRFVGRFRRRRSRS